MREESTSTSTKKNKTRVTSTLSIQLQLYRPVSIYICPPRKRPVTTRTPSREVALVVYISVGPASVHPCTAYAWVYIGRYLHRYYIHTYPPSSYVKYLTPTLHHTHIPRLVYTSYSSSSRYGASRTVLVPIPHSDKHCTISRLLRHLLIITILSPTPHNPDKSNHQTARYDACA